MIMSLSAESSNGAALDIVEESPLEVLSRAATMLRQESQQSALADESVRHAHKQTTKWKRDRRRLPEYSRKSDPKVPETFGAEPSSPEASISNSGSPLEHQFKKDQDQIIHIMDRPLDMTVKQRGHPPSYDQTMSNPDYRSSVRSNLMQNGSPPIAFNRDELPSGISMCDPVIEEHFRRSLGQDYHTLFQTNNPSKEKEPSGKPPQKGTSNIIEFMDDTGLTVDDHFAKALGDTWKQLNRKEENREHESSLVSAKN